ncbi:hypothetical protein NQ317_011352 [Molorchus minor]|uniref:Uncharacterized protein n=1 Tax=Molorchus minor TaxID=1323400 RepID=A0ABQ9IX92_9CUCU|nr:hypothetical protein NQ317_011352 [Molorchus minor]
MYGCINKMKMNEKFSEKIISPGIIGSHYPPTENNEYYSNVCRSCVGQLPIYLNFATVCETTEEEITKYCRQIDTNGHDLVELNHVRMFCNKNEIFLKNKSGNIGINCQSGKFTEIFAVKNVPCVVQQKTEYLGNDANHLLQSFQ